jgi:hypothetical protein
VLFLDNKGIRYRAHQFMAHEEGPVHGIIIDRFPSSWITSLMLR